jgi:dTDP-4-dehydrorhamnose reductase
VKILLTGQSGQLGGELAQSLHGLGEIIFLSRAQMDLSDLDQVRDVIRAIKPDLIVNPAAYTAVAKAESEPALATLINGEAPRVMAQEAQRLGAAMIHYSTDYVFDGTQSLPYAETAETHPINVYGQSKLAGEQAVATYCEAHWIVRCSWMYEVHGVNFLKTFWRLAQEREEVRIVNDQFGAPTRARSIAVATQNMLDQTIAPGYIQDSLAKKAGVYHFAATGATSWHGMAMHILRRMKKNGMSLRLQENAVLPIPASAWPETVRRPMNSRLQTEKIQLAFRLSLPDWRRDLDACISDLARSPL